MKRLPIAVVLSAGLGACGTVANVRDQIDQAGPTAQTTFAEHDPRPIRARVVERQGPLIPVTRVSVAKQSAPWLRQIRADFFNAPNPVPVSQFLSSISAKGVNIVSDMPLDSITYTGTVNSTDVESALRIVLGSVRLDYEVDNERRIVTIKPLPSRVWTLNIGNRRTSSSVGQVNSRAPLGGSSNQAGQVNSGNTGALGGAGGANNSTGAGQQAGGAFGGSQPGQSSTSASQGSSSLGGSNAGSVGISSEDDFWADMERELSRRLKVPMPLPRPRVASAGTTAGQVFPTNIPGMPMQGIPQNPAQSNDQGSATTAGASLVQLVDIGTFSLNPGTGAIRVVAPHWVLAELDPYIRGIQEMYNAVITFEGQLVLLNSTDDISEGIDMRAFGTWAAGRYGALLSNNSMGGVTVNFPASGVPGAVAGNATLGGPLFGIVDRKDGLQAFNNYMQRKNGFQVKGGLKVTTSSGVPASFSTLEPYLYQVVNQAAVVGNVGAAQQSTNYTIEREYFGTTMRVTPRYDLATGRVRALVTVSNNINAGEKSFEQKFGIGNTTQTINQLLPLPRKMEIEAEVNMRNGDLQLLGGQTFETSQTNEAGLPGGRSPLGGLFGTKSSNKVRSTYYFLLQMKISK